MRIITCNVNGLRAATKKGFFDWVKDQQADFICLQETKVQLEKYPELTTLLPTYHCFYSDAIKPGYSGVAIYTPHLPRHTSKKLGWPCADEEGRFIQLDYPDLSVVSLYLPSGTAGEHRQAHKFEFMENLITIFEEYRREKRKVMLCGDWNIAHKAIDLKNWRANQKNSGFLPEERAWLDKLFIDLGFIDAFRVYNAEPDQYTWWSHRGQAWAKNVGWRIDYQILTPAITASICQASIYKTQRFSDHAPLIIDYENSHLG